MPSADAQDVESLDQGGEIPPGLQICPGREVPDRFGLLWLPYIGASKQIGVKQGIYDIGRLGLYHQTSGSYQHEQAPERRYCQLQRGHVGIYLGGGQMIDASSSDGKTPVSAPISSPTAIGSPTSLGQGL